MNSPIISFCQLFDAVGQIQGRKKIQKIVYLLEVFGAPFGFRFGLHLYGPYSGDLQEKLDFYVRERLLTAVPDRSGEFPTSRFQAGPRLGELVQQVSAPGPADWAPFARELNKKSAHELEAISTLVFLQKAGKEGEALKKCFEELKPHFASRFEETLKEAARLQQEFLPA